MSAVQQPGLRPFIVFDSVPAGCVAYPVNNNRHAPLLWTGEWVIVATEQRHPIEGELFVIQWQSGGGPQIVEATTMKNKPYWVVGARHRGADAQNLGFGKLGDIIGDGPYRPDQLEQRFLGRVVGILQAAFGELRIVEGVA